jgi:beta-aspartyl-peptidase (threonine type)
MRLVGSENAGVGFADGMRILRAGGRTLDAVEATIRRGESNPSDHSVGYGGLPNIPGEMEPDASIMDGRSLDAGAVCAVNVYQTGRMTTTPTVEPRLVVPLPPAQRLASRDRGSRAG